MYGERNIATGSSSSDQIHCRNGYAPGSTPYPNHFYQYVEEDLLKAGESYKSFCVNVFRCNVWGDDLIAAAFGDMWNIAVSIISPVAKKPFHLFHTKSQPDVVLVCNGRNYLKHGGSTPYNGT